MSALTRLYDQHARPASEGLRPVFVGLVAHNPALAMTWVREQPHILPPTDLALAIMDACRSRPGEPLSEVDCRLSRFERPRDENPAVELQDTWLAALDSEGKVPDRVTWQVPSWGGPVSGSLFAWAISMGRETLVRHLVRRASPTLWQEVVDLPNGQRTNLAGLAVQARQWGVLALMVERSVVLPSTPLVKAWLHVTPRAGQALDQIKGWLDVLNQTPQSQAEFDAGLAQVSQVPSWGSNRNWVRHWTTALSARLTLQAGGEGAPITALELDWVSACLAHRGHGSLIASSPSLKDMARVMREQPLERNLVLWRAHPASHLTEPGRWSPQASFMLAIHHQFLNGRAPSSQELEIMRLDQLSRPQWRKQLDAPIETGRVCGMPCTLSLRGLLGLLSFELAPVAAWRPRTPGQWEGVLEALLLVGHHASTSPMRQEALARVLPWWDEPSCRYPPVQEAHDSLAPSRLLMYTAAFLRSGLTPKHVDALPKVAAWLGQAKPEDMQGWRGPLPTQVLANHFERLAERQPAWPAAWALSQHREALFELLSGLRHAGVQFQAERLEKMSRWSSNAPACQAHIRELLTPTCAHLPSRPRVRT